MFRNLISLIARPSTVKSRRRRGHNNLRSLLSIESLEDRIVLATSVTITPAAGVFGIQDLDYQYQKLATFVVTTDDFSLPAFSIDWGGDPTIPGNITPIESTFTRTDISLVPGETSTFEGVLYGTFSYDLAGPKTATITAVDPLNPSVELAAEGMAINVFEQHSGSETFSLLPPAGPISEAGSYAYTLNSSFGVSAISYSIDWGDSVQTGISTFDAVSLHSHTYADDSPFALNNYRISVAVETAGGTFAIQGPAVEVLDVAPSVVIDGPTSIAANDTYTLNLSSSDVSAEDQPVQWLVYWDYVNDPGTFEIVDADLTSVTHVYTTDGPRTIFAEFMDDDFLTTPSNTVDVTVGSQPTADAGGPYTTLADVPITLTGVGAGGTNLAYAWDLDGDDMYGELGEVGAAVTFDPAGVAGTRTVRLKVTDLDTNVVSEPDEAMITVNATGALVVDETLHVLGSGTGGDTVTVSVSGGNIVVNTGSGPQTFSLASIDELNVRTGGGNDIITIAAAVTIPTTVDAGDGDDLILGGGGRSVLMGGAGTDIIYGGAGDDVLMGGTGNDLLLGGGGNDALVGGGGTDILEGGDGRDVLVGGVGSDAILGGSGDDILIGGYTIHDGNVAALDQIMNTWTSGASLTARINLLTAVGGLLEANEAVFDDDAIDVITGGAGADLIFGDRSLFGDGAIDLIALQTAQDRLIALN
ncbi:MAG: hypothetical protein AB7G28_03395 [Pirellulales bacterium]